MTAPAPYSAASPCAPDDLDEWLLSLDEFSDETDLDDDDELRCAFDDPARQPLD